jgi:hypothetical protein
MLPTIIWLNIYSKREKKFDQIIRHTNSFYLVKTSIINYKMSWF